MSRRDAEDEWVDHLQKAHGIRAIRADEWTPQAALDVCREQRARYAHTDHVRALNHLADMLANELAEQTGVAKVDIVTVLLSTGGKLAALSLAGAPATFLPELMTAAADDLDRRADGEPTRAELLATNEQLLERLSAWEGKL